MKQPLFESTPQETFLKLITFRWAGRWGLISNGFALGMLVLGFALVVETHPQGVGRYLRAAFGESFNPAWYGYLLLFAALVSFGRRFQGVELIVAISPLIFYEMVAIFITLRYPSVERVTVTLIPWLSLVIVQLFYILEKTDADAVRATKPTDTDS